MTTKKLAIISFDCTGMWIYAAFQPEAAKEFIRYSTPLVSNLFTNDFDFIRFCENYDRYVEMEPELTEKGYKVDGIEIEMIHDTMNVNLIEKWIGRAMMGKDSIRVFCWSSGQFSAVHTEEERKELIYRFNHLPGYTFFFTERKEEEYEDEFHVVKYLEQWEGKSQTDRDINIRNQVNWCRTGAASPENESIRSGILPFKFKAEIERKLNS